MIYYLHHLQPPNPLLSDLKSLRFTQSDPELHDPSPMPSHAKAGPSAHNVETNYVFPTTSNPLSVHEKELQQRKKTQPRLLLAGYSYGAMITNYLPSNISSIISPFQTPVPRSAYAEIRLRADSLATQQNSLMKARVDSLLAQHPRGRSLQIQDHILQSPKLRNSNVRMGGEEDLRRASHESHRSRSSFTIETPESVRKSVDRIRSIGKHGRHASRRPDGNGSIALITSYKMNGTSSTSSAEQVTVLDGTNELETIKAIPEISNNFQVAYLLVSPLQGFVSSLATMWSTLERHKHMSEHDKKLTINPTLILFGDDDVFVRVKKLRSWVEKLSSAKQEGQEHRLRHREIAGASHFWHNHEAIQILREEVKEFVCTLRNEL
jgi:alpha/beta superfamily hydrolase